ncbi:MAG: DUF3821 domain-containing protein [Methanoregula sp.]|uniref:DUF3821 domain-containing protein n=1 Tax=Methanoregula sp. TaxID=2052170 RepID=UPI003D09C874
MAFRLANMCTILLFFLLVAVGYASAAPPIATISQGNTIFIGEQGLDIRGALGGSTQIGWWASAADIATSSPNQVVPISSPTSFYVDPTSFGSYTGGWYRLDNASKAAGPAFTVADPNLAVKVKDTTASIDATNSWVPRGDLVQFEIDTNLIAISQRSVSPTMQLYVQAPNGAQYSALVNGGTTTPIDNIQVTTSPFLTGPIWDTGNPVYPSGTYTVWVQCDVNGMKDNYGVIGKTISSQVTVLDQDQNPRIANSAYVTNPTTQITVLPTHMTTTIPPATEPITSQPSVSQTTIPQPTTLPASVSTPAPQTSVIPSITGQSTLPQPTRSPGFGFVVTVGAAIICFAVYSRKK